MFLAFLGYIVARDIPDIQEKSKELEEAKEEEQQTLKELKAAYEECRESNDKSVCDSIVENDPKANEIIHD
jgi:F0F1-type ATP synthase membrane subunit b/b'